MHRFADAMEAAAGIPLLHIADPTAAAIRADGFSRVGLLGTAFTMEQDFYKGRLTDRHGLEVLVPEAEDRATVHRIIYEELVLGRVEAASRADYAGVIARLVARGAEAVILGCTEIMLLVRPEDSAVPLYDTTTLHAGAAVEHALT
jgi:aspartate racemase